jgi:Tol biopolymer transport system component
MVWMNRMGQQIGSVVGDAANITDAERIRIAPDGRSVAVFRFNPVSHSIWQIDVITGSMRVVGENAGPGRTDGTPVWSPDGAFIAYENFAAGFFNLSLYSSPVGPGEITQLLSLLEDQKPNDWMENGHGDQFLLYEKSGYENSGRQTGWDLMVLPLDGKQTPIPIAATQARESNGRFAPNGKWIAYESSEAGKRKEIYVQPFPGTVDMRQKISALGGSEPRWRRDGSELYYIAPDNRLTAVPVKFSPNGESITLGRPTPLFSTPIPNGAEYEPHPDGQRFLLNAPTEGLPPVAPILVLSDWMSRLPNSGAAPAVPSPPGAGGNSRP